MLHSHVRADAEAMSGTMSGGVVKENGEKILSMLARAENDELDESEREVLSSLISTEEGLMNGSADRILATGFTVTAILLSLLGGLALVLRSLRNTDLSLSLSLKLSKDAGAGGNEAREGEESSDRGFPAHPLQGRAGS